MKPGQENASRNVPMQVVQDTANWSREDMSQSDAWASHLSDAEREELQATVRSVEAKGLDFLDIDRAAFPLPTLGPKLAVIRQELLYGRGFALLRGLEPDLDNKRGTALAFWGIGMHLGDQPA